MRKDKAYYHEMLQDADEWALKHMIKSLSGSFAEFANTEENNERLKAAKAILSDRRKRNRDFL